MCVNRSYIRILFIGLISVGVINGLYSYLSHVQFVQVAKNWSRDNNPIIDNGIQCNIISLKTSQDTCNNMAHKMANMTSNHPDWVCQKNVDYRSKSLAFELPWRTVFIELVITSIIYGICSIIHDWTLITHRNQLHKVQFHPVNSDDFVCMCNFYWCVKGMVDIVAKLPENWWTYVICGPFLCIIVIPVAVIAGLLGCIAFFFDLSWNLLLYPLVCCIKKNKKRVNGGLSYVSSTWVGLSRFWMMMLAATMASVSVTGFSVPISSLNSEQCACGCVYVLQERDAYGFIVVAYIFIIVNTKFLWSWMRESTHGHHVFYLIKYSIPAALAAVINPHDITGSMLPYNIDIRFQECVEGHANEISRHLSINDNCDPSSERHTQTKLSKTKYVFRLGITGFGMMFSIGYLVFGMFQVASYNQYNYSQAIQTSIYVSASISAFVLLVLYVCSIRYSTNIMPRFD
eukprot:498227_1